MLDRYDICCLECGYEESFYLGRNMLCSKDRLLDFDSDYPLLNNLISSSRSVNRIKELINQKNAEITEYGLELFFCPKCSSLYGKFNICLKYDGGKYKKQYKCVKCGADLKKAETITVTDNDGWEKKKVLIKMLACPDCGKKSLMEHEAEDEYVQDVG